jgi:RNA polymerase sigma-70 factor (ECF subfamily)
MSGMNLSGLTDEALATRAIEDHACLELLLGRYTDKIRACAWKMVGNADEIDDLTQETLLRLIRSLPSFKARSTFATWVYQVAHNTCVDAYRRRARQPAQVVGLDADRHGLEPADELAAESTDPEALFEDAIAECYVEQALRALPPDYARIATLRLIDGWSNEQIAAELGTSVDSVKGKLKRARARLRSTLSHSRACPLCSAGSFRFDEAGLS